jgi:Cu-Zn family superoxide dismutase
MNRKLRLALFAAALGVSGLAAADYKVDMNAIDAKGVGASLGTVKIAADPKGGVVLTPDLKGLPAGEHGFHVHEKANCSAMQKDGKLEPGEGAGPHFDPKATHKHAGPSGPGHLGDLPALTVAADGSASQPVTAPHMKLTDFRNRSLVIHEGGDNYSDQPKPNGGGGTRIACGVVEPAGKK